MHYELLKLLNYYAGSNLSIASKIIKKESRKLNFVLCYTAVYRVVEGTHSINNYLWPFGVLVVSYVNVDSFFMNLVINIMIEAYVL